MAGLLNGAMMGLGQGMSEAGNFLLRAKADEVKEARLQKYEREREQRQAQRQDVIRAEDRAWQLDDYKIQRSDAVEDRDFNADMTRWQVNTTQAGANARSAAQIAASREQRPQWQMVPDGNGGYIQYDPVTNNYREANLPEGVTLASDGKLTDIQEARLKEAQDIRKAINERHMGDTSSLPANHPDLVKLGEAEATINAILRSGSDGDLATRLSRQLGVDANDTSSTPFTVNAPQQGSAPPRPGQPAPASSTQESPENFSGLINQAMADQRQQQANRQSAAEQRQIESQINTIRGLAARAGRGPGMSQADRDSLGRQAVEQAEALMQQGNLTAEQVQRLRSAAEDVVRFTELDFN